MEMWRAHMPKGMLMKSDGFACDLYDPERRFTLRKFCADRGIAYEDTGLPVRLDTFVDYGTAFQRALVPGLTEQPVNRITNVPDGFRVEITGGESVTARAVVVATGICYCAHIPQELGHLPPERCTHSSAHHELSEFAGRKVIVVGGGASATDIAALLHAQGTHVELLSRKPIEFHTRTDPKSRTLWKRIREPNLGLGPNLRSAVYTAFPGLFHLLPRDVRLRITRGHLPPAGGYFVRHHVEGKVPMHIGYAISDARVSDRGVVVRCRDEAGKNLELIADHVIAASGYRPSIDRLDFLDARLRAAIRREDDAPLLSRHFESTAAGLYFIGLPSSNSFGPVMRFARGAEWAAAHLSRHLAAACRHQGAGAAVATAAS
jgi:hypothetical protein